VNLERQMGLHVPGNPSHDEMQALIGALAGLGPAVQDPDGYEAIGAPLREIEGTWREGYIVNPTAETETDLYGPRWQRRQT
jgi:hypothetical protein